MALHQILRTLRLRAVVEDIINQIHGVADVGRAVAVGVAGGIYFYRINTGGNLFKTKKMLLLK
jgi:hypothetical protein